MPRYRIEQFLQEATVLPPIPQTVHKALSLLRDSNLDVTYLADVLSADQVLSAQVLRWSNSAYYGMRRQIMTVHQAIVVLGLDVIRQMMMLSSVSGHLNQALPGYGLAKGELWNHALGTALGAQLISQQQALQVDEEAYFAGLLCDIGKLVLEKHFCEIELHTPEREHQSFLELERACFGMDHARLGAELARHWQLPEDLEIAISFHHEPREALHHKTLVAAVHIADVLMNVLGVGMGIDGLRYPVDKEALQILNLTWEDLYPLSEQVAAQLSNASELIPVN